MSNYSNNVNDHKNCPNNTMMTKSKDKPIKFSGNKLRKCKSSTDKKACFSKDKTNYLALAQNSPIQESHEDSTKRSACLKTPKNKFTGKVFKLSTKENRTKETKGKGPFHSRNNN